MSRVKAQKQTPHKYLEGFVSLYMIPIHGLGVYFFINHFFLIRISLIFRYLLGRCFTICEIIGVYLSKSSWFLSVGLLQETNIKF